jgi:hypothetical protein
MDRKCVWILINHGSGVHIVTREDIVNHGLNVHIVTRASLYIAMKGKSLFSSDLMWEQTHSRWLFRGWFSLERCLWEQPQIGQGRI